MLTRRRSYGKTEIPIQYKFFGARKTVFWAEKSVRKVIDSMEKGKFELYQAAASREIYEYVFHENCSSNYVPALQRVVLGKSFICSTKKVSVL